MMEITVLGSGTSTGVPEIGCKCEVCKSEDPRDHRLRTSLWVEMDDTTLLLDCGPDFRQQMLRLNHFHAIDGVLISHEHYDHVAGLDDLRPFSRINDIPIYCNKRVKLALEQRMPYCFITRSYPGIPKLTLEEVFPRKTFKIKNVEVTPIEIMHGKLPILGYLLQNKLVYITDMLNMDEANYDVIGTPDVLVINALRIKPHVSHQTIDEALEVVKKIGAKRSFLIHMSHDAGLHIELQSRLPKNVYLAYDGLVIKE